MRLPLIIGEVGLGIAGISALVSYGVKATDLKNPVVEIENLEDKLKKEEEKLKQEVETIKQKIVRLISNIKNFFKENFPKEKNSEFLTSLQSFWSTWLDNVNDSNFNLDLDGEKQKLMDLEQKNKFKSKYSDMKDLAGLWKDLTDRTSDCHDMLREFHKLFYVN